ncbi:transmembrane protein 248-like isoform X1 [Corythoichthys intestinalis]|uniref:transmembrane protein 248-like isoform X1 n=1 Tax=Corythoichthys intestinalis TaxID=161448 RepID=UPI0025A50A87|nr:transmembrane protein 248-like isoform X1 [Corythoichthys intestinalis]
MNFDFLSKICSLQVFSNTVFFKNNNGLRLVCSDSRYGLMMASWQPVSNIKDFMSQNPPAVTFFLCLLTLAISFICLGSYSINHTLPNPDTTKDWNHLLSTLAHFHLCARKNWSSDVPVSRGPPSLTEQGTDGTISPDLTSHTTTLHLAVPLAITTNHDLPKNVDLFTTFTASQLHLEGNEIVNVDIHSVNDTYSCLTIRAPIALFPMSRLPPVCHAPGNNRSLVHVEATDPQLPASQACYSLVFRNDPTLTVMLTKEEQWVAVRHLIEVSVCLIGVCLILCLAASLTHSMIQNYHRKGLDLQNVNEPLLDT